MKATQNIMDIARKVDGVPDTFSYGEFSAKRDSIVFGVFLNGDRVGTMTRKMIHTKPVGFTLNQLQDLTHLYKMFQNYNNPL